MIPPITHELGKYWDQPDRALIEVDETHAIMDRATFLQLASYDDSIPSGVYEGKMWKRATHGGELLCWFGPGRMANSCRIHYREIIVV